MITNLDMSRTKTAWKRVFSVVLAVAVVASVLGTVALAGKDYTGNNAVPGVKQGDNGSTFASNAHAADIYIHQDIIDDPTKAEVMRLVADEIKGFEMRQGSTLTKPHEVEEDAVFFVYNPRQEGARPLKKDEDNYFPGNLYRFTYRNAATLPDGTLGHVQITYSDLHIALQDNVNADAAQYTENGVTTTYGDFAYPIYVAGGNELRAGSDYNRMTVGAGGRVGFQVNAHIRVIDRNGHAVDGTFFYPMTDIDVTRTGNFSRLYDAGKYMNYSEQIRVNSGLAGGSESNPILGGDIFIPDADGIDDTNDSKGYKCAITGGDGMVLFQPGGTDNANGIYGSFYSGFAAIVNNSVGISLTGWLSGGGYYNETQENNSGDAGAVRSFLLRGAAAPEPGSSTPRPISLPIKSSTGSGGNIRTMTAGNYINNGTDANPDYTQYGTLTDGSKEKGPGILTIPRGKTMVYTMDAMEGYNAEQFVIYQTITSDNPEATFKFKGDANDPNYIDLSGGPVTKTVNGQTYKFTKSHTGNGLERIIVELPDIQNERHIHVDWTCNYYFNKVWVGESEDPDSVTFIATPYVWDPINERLAPLNPNTNAADTDSTTVNGVSFTVGDTVGKIKAKEIVAERDSALLTNADNYSQGSYGRKVQQNNTSILTYYVYYPESGSSSKDWDPLPREAIGKVTEGGVTQERIYSVYWFATEKDGKSTPPWSLQGYTDGPDTATSALAIDKRPLNLYTVYDTNGYVDEAASAANLAVVNSKIAQAVQDPSLGAYMGILPNKGGVITNTATVITATKSWDDQDNRFNTRQDVILHLNAQHQDGILKLDVMPPQVVKASATGQNNTEADSLVVTWGDGLGYEVPSAYSSFPGVVADGTSSTGYRWPASLDSLPGTDASGNPITYQVREETLHGYTSVVR